MSAACWIIGRRMKVAAEESKEAEAEQTEPSTGENEKKDEVESE